MKYLGIDLGGTNVAAAVVDSEGTILGKVSLPTPRGAGGGRPDGAAARGRRRPWHGAGRGGIGGHRRSRRPLSRTPA